MQPTIFNSPSIEHDLIMQLLGIIFVGSKARIRSSVLPLINDTDDPVSTRKFTATFFMFAVLMIPFSTFIRERIAQVDFTCFESPLACFVDVAGGGVILRELS